MSDYADAPEAERKLRVRITELEDKLSESRRLGERWADSYQSAAADYAAISREFKERMLSSQTSNVLASIDSAVASLAMVRREWEALLDKASKALGKAVTEGPPPSAPALGEEGRSRTACEHGVASCGADDPHEPEDCYDRGEEG